MNRSVGIKQLGISTTTPEIREMSDEIGYTWPEIMMVFAAGNTDRRSDTWSPSNSKIVTSQNHGFLRILKSRRYRHAGAQLQVPDWKEEHWGGENSQ